MGFTIANYSLFDLQPQNIYVSIHAGFTIEKNNVPSVNGPIWIYAVRYVVYYQAAANSQVITKKDACFSIEQLPEPANIYPMIYDEIKKDIGPQYTITDD